MLKLLIVAIKRLQNLFKKGFMKTYNYLNKTLLVLLCATLFSCEEFILETPEINFGK